MSGLVFVAAMAALPLLGWGLMPRRATVWLPHPAAAAVAAGLGALVLSVEMLAMAFVGIRWTAARIATTPLLLTALRLVVARCRSRVPTEAARGRPGPTIAAAAGIAAGLLVCAYASLTTRATSADLLLFWGAKAERFAAAGAIDVGFLKDPQHWGLHTDYPPLLPSLWAFASLCAGRFAWGASLATLPIAAAFLVVASWGLARRGGNEHGAAWAAALVAAMAAATWLVSGTAGNADPMLLFLEGTALLLILFAGEEPGAPLLAGALLAAATLTKFEGTFFAGALSASSLLLGRRGRWRRAATIAVPSAAALLAWIAFCRTRGLFTYLGQAPEFHLGAARLGIVVRGLIASASYDSAYLPWIVAVAVLLAGRPARARLATALGAAALILAADILIYLVSPTDPTLWVAWSGARLLLTPLFCLYAAAAGGLAEAAPSRSDRGRTRTAVSAAPSA